MGGHRPDQVGALVREEIMQIIRRDLKDPRLGFVSIPAVRRRAIAQRLALAGAEHAVEPPRGVGEGRGQGGVGGRLDLLRHLAPHPVHVDSGLSGPPGLPVDRIAHELRHLWIAANQRERGTKPRVQLRVIHDDDEERRLFRLMKTFKERAKYSADWAKKADAAETRWRRWREAERLSRCLFAAAGMRRRYR